MTEVVVKQLTDKNKWEGVPLTKMLDNSIINYMLEETRPTIACMYVDKKPAFFVSNDQSYVDMYKDKGFSFHVQEMHKMFCKQLSHPLITHVTEVFPDAQFSCYSKTSP